MSARDLLLLEAILLGLAAGLGLSIYLIMQASPESKAKQVYAKSAKWVRQAIDDPGEAASVLAIAGIVIAVLGFVMLYVLKLTSNLVSDFYANVATELLSIAVTVLIIDRLYARRSANEEKQRIIKQLASRSNEFALEAVRLCSENGREWLKDGTLKNTNFWGANLAGAYLADANLEGATLAETNLSNANLGGANLKGAELLEANFESATLNSANLKGANLVAANLTNASLSNACLEDAKLGFAHLQQTKLAHANFRNADMRKAVFVGAILWDTTLAGAYLLEANFEGVFLEEANLEGAILAETNLKSALMKNVNLMGANLWKANLESATLNSANLRGAYFEGANLEGVHMMAAIYDTYTTWPKGFDVKAAGARSWDAMSQDEKTQWLYDNG